MITYAAGVEAKVVILICKDLREEHRTAIDWLNHINSGEIKFFAIRVEAWQIDEYPKLAPKFNILCEPDYWSKNIKQSVEIPKGDLTETKKMQYEFWSSFNEYLKDKKSPLKIRKPFPQHWYDSTIGTPKGYLSFVVDTRQKLVSASFYSANDEDKRVFKHLLAQKQEIEKEIGSPLIWMELLGKKASRIKVEKPFDIGTKEEWLVAFEFLRDQGEKIYRIFPKYLRDLGDE